MNVDDFGRGNLFAILCVPEDEVMPHLLESQVQTM